MDPQVKETLSFYAIWGTMMGMLTILIRPFISVRQVIRDSIITFLFSFLCGLLLEYFEFSIPFKCGISGVAGLFGVFIYNIFVKMFAEIEKDPVFYLWKFKNGRNKYK